MSGHVHHWYLHSERNGIPEHNACRDCLLTEVTFANAVRHQDVVSARLLEQQKEAAADGEQLRMWLVIVGAYSAPAPGDGAA